jgi:YD repeat-containing protein
VKPTLAILVFLIGATDALADDRDWPLRHDVLSRQRVLPCKEIRTNGKTGDATTYAMTFDRAGQLVRREERPDSWQRYTYASRHVVKIEGKDYAGEFTSTVQHSKHGLASIQTHEKTRHGVVESEVTWTYEGDKVVLSSTYNGEKSGSARKNYERGRLVSIDLYAPTNRPSDPHPVTTVEYDALGRLASLKEESAARRYFYDARGRLEREEFEAKGIIDESIEYSYSCK